MLNYPGRGLEPKQPENAVDGVFHDELHFVIRDPRIAAFAVASGTSLAGVHVLDWAVAKRQDDDGFRFTDKIALIGFCCHFECAAFKLTETAV